MSVIPDRIWKSETHHSLIRQSAGPCVACRERPRDLNCRWCGDPMCAKCLGVHQGGPIHARERYIERLADGKISWMSATIEEREEAAAFRVARQIEAEDAERAMAPPLKSSKMGA